MPLIGSSTFPDKSVIIVFSESEVRADFLQAVLSVNNDIRVFGVEIVTCVKSNLIFIENTASIKIGFYVFPFFLSGINDYH